jgi:hypothetical protein
LKDVGVRGLRLQEAGATEGGKTDDRPNNRDLHNELIIDKLILDSCRRQATEVHRLVDTTTR